MMKKTANYNKEGFENLANAIIQVVKDYRKALSGCKVEKRDSKSVIAECERFFRSEWFRELTDIDGEYLITRIRKEYGL